MDFNMNLPTCYGKTFLRAFLKWIAEMNDTKMKSAKQPGVSAFKEGAGKLVISNPNSLSLFVSWQTCICGKFKGILYPI